MVANLSFKDGADTPIVNTSIIKKIVYEDNTGNKYTFGVDNATNVFNTFKYDPNGADHEVDYSATATNFMTGGAIATLLGIGTNVDAIKTKTDKMPADLGIDLTTIKTETNKIAAIGTNVDEIKTKTDKMPADLGIDLTTIKTETNKIAAIGTNVDEIKTKTDIIPADLSADLVTIKTQVGTNLISGIKAKTDQITDTLGADVNAIKAKTDKMPADLKDELGKLTVVAEAISKNGNVDEAANVVLESSFKKAIEQAGKNGSDWLESFVADIVSQLKFDIPASDDAPLNWTW